MEFRQPFEHELSTASMLCLKSKSHWGYDDEFMSCCKNELTLTADDLLRSVVCVALVDEIIVGVGQVSKDDQGCFLDKLFVDPARMGLGVGRRLFEWAVETASDTGATEMIVESDPAAAGFYRRMGCIDAGFVPSGSIPGRTIPRLLFRLQG